MQAPYQSYAGIACLSLRIKLIIISIYTSDDVLIPSKLLLLNLF